MSFYDFLIFVHVASAILGLGPGFVMIYIVTTKARTMEELRHAYVIRNRIHIFVMVGGTLLLLTGLLMGVINTYLFTKGWFVLSLILFLIALAAGPIVLSPKSKPIKELLATYEGDLVPAEYYALTKELFFYERITNVIFLIIIALMILKPF